MASVNENRLMRTIAMAAGDNQAGPVLVTAQTNGDGVIGTTNGGIAKSAPKIVLGDASAVYPDMSGLFTGDCIPGSLTAAKTAIATNACTVAFWGDSVTEDGNTVDNVLNYHGTYRSVVMEALKLAFPACAFTMRNYGLSSRTGGNAVDANYKGQAAGPENIATGFYRTAVDNPNWGDGTGSVSGKSWLNHVKDSTPHLLVVAFGLNPQMDGSIQAHLAAIQTAIATWTPVPSVVLVPAFRPAVQYQDQYRAQAVARVYREFARRNGWSFLDVNRAHNIVRDGFDETQGLWVCDNQNSLTWANWKLLSGTAVQNDAYTITLGPDSYMYLDVDSHDVSVQVTADTRNTNNTGVLHMRARDESALAQATTFPQYAFLRGSQSSMQLWDGAAQLGASYAMTPTGSNKFRLDLVGAGYVGYVDGVQRAAGVSYANMRGGRIVVGAFGGTVGGLVLSNPKVFYKTPRKYTPSYSDAELLGTPYSAVDFGTRYPYGGNGANHPSSIGTQVLYGAPVRELIRALR